MDNEPRIEEDAPISARRRKESNKLRKYLIPAIIVIVLIIVIALIVNAVSKRTAVKQYTTNTQISQQYQKQLPELKSAVDKNKEDGGARKNYAVALYATGDVEAAKTQYEEAIKIDPKDALAHNNLGNMQRELKDYDGAIASYRKAIELNPKSLNPYVNLGNVLLYSKNQPKEAIAVYQSGLKELPQNTQLESLLATAYERDNNIEGAKGIYNEILKRDPNSELAKTNLDRLNKQN